LPAIGATRFTRHTASSFIASKVERHPGRSYRDLGRPLEPGLPANQATRFTRHFAFMFIAGKRAPTEELRNLWERCLPAIWATRIT